MTRSRDRGRRGGGQGPRLEVRIDALVVDRGGELDPARFARALREELARQLAGVPPSQAPLARTLAVERLDGGAVARGAADPAAAAAQRLGRLLGDFTTKGPRR